MIVKSLIIDQCYQCKEVDCELWGCGICSRIFCNDHEGILGFCEMCWLEELDIADYGPYDSTKENLK